MTQYDGIAADYVRVKQSNAVDTYCLYPSLYDAIGPVTGKTVLDLACGEGKIGRTLSKLGASYVLGVDESVKMLGIAVSRKPLGLNIDYRLGRVGTLAQISKFDVVVGGWLLHYASTKSDLWRMCRDIACNLKPGGIYVMLNGNPESSLGGSTQYGYTVTAESPTLQEGDPLTVTVMGDGTSSTFRTYYWRRSTYAAAMGSANLTFESFVPKPTDKGIRTMGVEFWRELEQCPTSAIFRGTQRAL